MNKKLFISKNASEIEPYRSQFAELGYSIVNHSFLSFSAVEFDVENDFDVLFFGSVRAVIFFNASQSISRNKLIACVGGKTAELLESLGHEVAFVGGKSGEPKVVGEEFKVWLTSAPLSPGTSTPFRQAQRGALSPRVLFPVSDRSLRTISGSLPDTQKEEVAVYSTEVKGKVVEVCDVYVFTSPSNVEGFFLENTIPVGSRVIAWGKSTESALMERGVSADYCLKESGFEEVISFLDKIQY